jgi:hypothetical protein
MTESLTVPDEPAFRVPPSVQVTIPFPIPAGGAEKTMLQDVIPAGRAPHEADWYAVYSGTISVMTIFWSAVEVLGLLYPMSYETSVPGKAVVTFGTLVTCSGNRLTVRAAVLLGVPTVVPVWVVVMPLEVLV